MFTLHCKPLYTPTDITPPNTYPTLARLRRHTHQTCLIIKPIPWGKSDRATDLTNGRLFSTLNRTKKYTITKRGRSV